MAYLLDTSLCVALLREKPLACQWFDVHRLLDMSVSTVTEMELQIGVWQRGAPMDEQERVNLLLGSLQVLPWDSAAARVTAEKYHFLAGQGNLEEAADTFIAGQALSLGYTLVTADSHLLRRARAIGLKVEDYRTAGR